MQNFIQKGDTLTVTAPTGGVVSGQGLLVGAVFGVATDTAGAGASVGLLTEGVVELPKASAAVFAVGAKVSWDNNNARSDVPASGRYPIGAASEGAANGDATVRVRLDGVSTAAA